MADLNDVNISSIVNNESKRNAKKKHQILKKVIKIQNEY